MTHSAYSFNTGQAETGPFKDHNTGLGFLSMREHPLRRRLSEELHARPFHDFEGAGRFIRFIFLFDETDAEIISYINQYLQDKDQQILGPDTKFARIAIDNFAMRVERHTEFVSISLIEKGLAVKTGLSKDAFTSSALPHLPFEWIRQMPGKLFHAIWLEIGGKPPARLASNHVRALLDSRDAPSNMISDGAAQLHVSFDIDSEGFSRAALFNLAIPATRMGRIVQRVIEMETYRMLTLLGLATAQAHGRTLNSVDEALSRLTNSLSEQIATPDKKTDEILPELSQLSAQLEETFAQTGFRMTASKAYSDVFLARLDALRPTYLDGFQGIRGFIDRRMLPALQTCAAFTNRLERLATRVDRSAQLLRTQTEMTIQQQNRDLLVSMDRRAQVQLRLQQTVEGLSIAALTYYSVGLVHYIAQAMPLAQWGLQIEAVKALSVPVIAVLVWRIIRRASRAARSVKTED